MGWGLVGEWGCVGGVCGLGVVVWFVCVYFVGGGDVYDELDGFFYVEVVVFVYY